MTPHQQQLIADNESKRKEMMNYAKELVNNGLMTSARFMDLYYAITDKYNAIEKTIKENKK